MQFVLIMAILGAVVAGDMTPARGVDHVPVVGRLLLTLLTMAVVVLAARVIAGLTVVRLRRDEWPRSAVLARFERLRRGHTVLWLAAVGVILFGFGWPQVVRQQGHLGGSLFAEHLAILLPVLLPLVISWWVFGEVERATTDTRGTIPFFEYEKSAQSPGRLHGVWMRVRHELAIVLVPLLAVVAAHDLVSRLAPGLGERQLTWVVYVPLFGLLLAAFPWLLRYIWQTEPLPAGPLRDRLRQVEQRLGVGTREILVWRTGGSLINAAVSGFLPRLRYVFLTDALLTRMSDDEVAAVYAHELGHVRHRHLTLRVLAIALPIVMGQALVVSYPETAPWLWRQAMALGIAPPIQAAIGTLAAAGLYALLVFGRYSRLLEHQADLSGCCSQSAGGELTAEGAQQFVAAMSTLAANCRQQTGSNWLHPGFADRIDFVRCMAARPAEREVFERRLRGLSWLLLGLVVASVLSSMVVQTVSVGGL